MMRKHLPAKDVERFTLPSSEKVVITAPFLPDTPETQTFWHTTKGKIWTTLFGLSIVLALVIGLFMYREGTIKSIPQPVSVADPQASPTPTPETLDISLYKVEILNGSGIAGEAARVKAMLEEEKFTVFSIGNASNSANQQTSIRAKRTVPKEYLDTLQKVLETSYVLLETIEFSDTGASDVVITVGKEKISE